MFCHNLFATWCRRLAGNPVCESIHLSGTGVCLIEPETSPPPTNQANCESKECSKKYNCLHPYEGVMIFRAPLFQVVTNNTLFELLEKTLWSNYSSFVASVSLQNPVFDDDFYLEVHLKLCPHNGISFNRTEILMELDLSARRYKPPKIFGPYYFSALPYDFSGVFFYIHAV